MAVVAVVANVRGSEPLPASTLQTTLWNSYLTDYWHDSGQTTDPANHGYTTSEAQSYTLLRAVWQNDPSTFAATWQWTAGHLQRSDKLFSWLYGPSGIANGQGGQNTASDADTTIALALILASGRWHNDGFLNDARAIVQAIWDKEVITVNGTHYLVADNLEPASTTPLINPSYFSPAAFRLFAKVDPGHDWSGLADQSYMTLQAAAQSRLGSDSSANLPPDWVTIDRQTGLLRADPSGSHDTNFGFDAFRAVWQTALDWQWNHPAEAKNTLAMFNALLNSWNQHHKLYAIYTHAGQPAVNYSSVALYGGTLGYFSAIHPQTASAIYKQQLLSLFDPRTSALKSKLGYYDNNWAWFGIALYNGQLKAYAPPGVNS